MVREEMSYKRVTCSVRDAHTDAQYWFHDQPRWCLLPVLGRVSRPGWASRTQHQLCSRGELGEMPHAKSAPCLQSLCSGDIGL